MIKFSQIAICIPDEDYHNRVIKNVSNTFGEIPYTDKLMMSSVDNPNSPLMLSFFHNLIDGAEVEYITSSDMDHWHNKFNQRQKPFLSHLGAYLSSDEFDRTVKTFTDLGFEIIHNTESHSHSNTREDGSERRYQDVIFGTNNTLGFNIKLTRKI